MVDKHNYSFFGQKVALIVNSPSKQEPHVFFTFIRKRENGTWEKLSKKEGKVIKFSLEELVMILQVLRQKSETWSAFHSYQDKKTQITFKWDIKEKEGEAGAGFVITLNGYTKPLVFSQVEMLRMLLKHLLKEKIKFATSSSVETKVPVEESQASEFPNFISPETEERTYVEEEIITNHKKSQGQKPMTIISGVITSESSKAVHIKFEDRKELWLPKSVLHSPYDPNNTDKPQKIQVETWILKKNQLIV